ncbi:MAG TPA: hypothetical protein VN515_04465 [Terriglobales bacterium]|nr:hypothetical protein [Terriglobales bacterium]
MNYSRAEWLRAAACGLAGAVLSIGVAANYTDSIPLIPRLLIFCVGAVAAMPGAIIAGTFFETAPTGISIAVMLATSGLFWMWVCLRVTRRRNARRTEKLG